MIVPGAGEPNFDSFENNPFMDKQQRREAEVQNLLNKLNHELIALDSSFVGTVEQDPQALQKEQQDIVRAANEARIENAKKSGQDKNRKRGRNKISKHLRRKQKNVIDAQALKLQAKKNHSKQHNIENVERAKGPLARFMKK